MTRAQKIAWIKRAISRIAKYSGTELGMCTAFWFGGDVEMEDVKRFMNRIGLKKPKETFVYNDAHYWFPLNSKGKATRLRIMRAALKRLQNKQTKKK